MNSDEKAAFNACLREALLRHDQRNSVLDHGPQISFEQAVDQVASVFRMQQDAFEPWGSAAEEKIGARLQEGLVEYGRQFKSFPPEPWEVDDIILKSISDHYAFSALEMLNKLTHTGTYVALDRWANDVFLGIRRPPSRSKGASRNKFLARDVLIIGQIERLVSVGFSPTRNLTKKVGRNKQSACDVISHAAARDRQKGTSVTSLEYAAVEKIWKQRGERRNLGPLADLVSEMLKPLSAK